MMNPFKILWIVARDLFMPIWQFFTHKKCVICYTPYHKNKQGGEYTPDTCLKCEKRLWKEWNEKRLAYSKFVAEKANKPIKELEEIDKSHKMYLETKNNSKPIIPEKKHKR